jgi:hypothetical protein
MEAARTSSAAFRKWWSDEDGGRNGLGSPTGAGTIRKEYWGFDFTKLPVHGRVWYPDGAGPFPLVLIVHGNTT